MKVEHSYKSAPLFINEVLYFNRSQGFKPVCFLKAAEKCEMEE